ncbi:hypothetical protein [Vibrio phage BONAISHI]|nr:hypothetical protein [Vibrio phage BONAISHI]
MQIIDYSKKGWMESRKNEIIIPVIVDMPMEIKINGLSRDTAGYYLEAPGSAQLINEDSAMYAHGNKRIYDGIMDGVKAYCTHHGYGLNEKELEEITEIVNKGFILCDSTYGSETKNWAEHECDAYILIKGSN